jgi:hypothetical protein
MKVFTASHYGVYLGGCSVIVAKDEATARTLLSAELEHRKLKQDGVELRVVDADVEQVIMLTDGDY